MVFYPCLFCPSDNVWRSPRSTHTSTVITPSGITQQSSVEKCVHRGASACREGQTMFKIVTWTKQTWTSITTPIFLGIVVYWQIAKFGFLMYFISNLGCIVVLNVFLGSRMEMKLLTYSSHFCAHLHRTIRNYWLRIFYLIQYDPNCALKKLKFSRK